MGNLPLHESPRLSVPVPTLFHAHRHQVGACLWVMDAKALAALGTEPRCKTQLRVSAKVWGTELEPTLELGLEIKWIQLQNLGRSKGGLERPISTTAKSYCMAGCPTYSFIQSTD